MDWEVELISLYTLHESILGINVMLAICFCVMKINLRDHFNQMKSVLK